MNLQEALQDSGVVEEVRQIEKQAVELARKEKSAALPPHQRWWQNFRLSVTPFEIKVFIKVQCTQWTEGLDFIGARNLNKVTTRCRTIDEAREQVRAKIVAWQAENVLGSDHNDVPAGALLYWRIYS